MSLCLSAAILSEISIVAGSALCVRFALKHSEKSIAQFITMSSITANMQQGTLLDVLKKKMRQTKEEMEKYKDECEDYHKKLQAEINRREEVCMICGCV